MLADFGFATILIAFCSALFATGASWYGARRQDWRWIESARNAALATFPLTLLACGILVFALWTNDFSIEYVVNATSIETPKYLKITALWGGQKGSLLFWNMLLALFTAAAMYRKWDGERELMPYAIGIASLTQVFFLFLSGFVENPFTRIASVPFDGQGLNPLLRHPGMIIHPPTLYLGFVGFTIPYAFAMAALISGRLDDGWIRTTRRWTLIAWLFLSLGLILGGRWAYDVLGWGGYWGWDPVENASFMPWLAGTAFLHSVIIQQKRGMFKVWNMFLIILTYLLVITGTFIVRSGLVSSVHTFAESSIGWYFLIFVTGMTLLSFYWLSKRQASLASKNQLQSLLSRESAFLLNNFLIIAILAATALGVYFPVLSELMGQDRITVGAPYYEKVNGPLFAALVLLMGVAPLTMWHRTALQRIGKQVRWPLLIATICIVVLTLLGIRQWLALVGIWCVAVSAQLTLLEFWKAARARMKRGESFLFALRQLFIRDRQRYGGYMIHMGVIIMALGVIGIEFFQQETQVRLNVGESVTLGRYRMQFNGTREEDLQDSVLARIASIDLYENGVFRTMLTPRSELHLRTRQTMTIPDLHPTIAEDFYTHMVNWEDVTADAATFRVMINPLVNWVWTGGFVFALGTFIATWPDPEEKKVLAAMRVRTSAVPTD